jgi:hypothetical protein
MDQAGCEGSGGIYKQEPDIVIDGGEGGGGGFGNPGSGPGGMPSVGVGGSATPTPRPRRVANRIDCNTKLPDGSTVGDRVRDLSNNINNRAQFTSTPYGPVMQAGGRSDPLSVVSDVYSGTNFRKMFGGAGANYALATPAISPTSLYLGILACP